MFYTDCVNTSKHKRKNSFNKAPFFTVFKRWFVYFGVLLLSMVILCLSSVLILTRKKYDLDIPVNVAAVYEDKIVIIRFDPEYDDLMELVVDGDIKMETSAGLGEYLVKNLYTLSLNETNNSKMFKNTIMKNLHIPIFSILDCRSEIVNDTSSFNVFDCLSNRNKITDLVFLIYCKIQSQDHYFHKNLEEYHVVNKQEDGLQGIDEDVFDKLEFDFSQDLKKDEVFSVKLLSDGNLNIPLYFYDIIKVSGGRVVDYEKRQSDYISDCMVESSDKRLNKYFATIFDCNNTNISNGDELNILFSSKHIKNY